MISLRTSWPRMSFAACLLLSLDGSLVAQFPALAPTQSTTIVVPAGPLHYSSITIPADVEVRFVAPGAGHGTPGMPAVLLCDGDAIVFGYLTVNGYWRNAAGWVTTGRGQDGLSCGEPFPFPPPPNSNYTPPHGGSHAGAYGSAIPFSLEGGSFGGDLAVFDSACGQFVRLENGGGGGGTLVLLARGRIEIHGTVTADGRAWFSGGSGGSILLRGDAGVFVMPGSSVTARGSWGGVRGFLISDGAPGYIRLDAWGTAPQIQGNVDPAPTVLELPYLRGTTPPRIGTSWVLDVLAPENSPVFLSVSLQPGRGASTPFGRLGIDLSVAAGLGVTVPQPSHDPMASVSVPIPNAPVLVGLPLWVQGIAAPPSLPARLTNRLGVVIE